MCGIVGCAGDLIPKDHKIFRDLLLIDVIRGQDSTGILRVTKFLREITVDKDIGPPQNLWEYQDRHGQYDLHGVIKYGSKVLLGHNRAATVGQVSVDNAHPFTFGDITGVHNGTLYNHTNLMGNFDIDSKKVFYTISEKGIDYTWERLMGAASLVWWDDKESTLNFIRNDQRPMFTLYDEFSKTLYWASESAMLTLAFVRNRKNWPKGKDGKILVPTSTQPDTLYTYDVVNKEIFLKESRPVKKYQPVTKTYAGYSPSGAGTKMKTPKGTGKGKKDKSKKINFGWTNGKHKADKSVRGEIAVLKYSAGFSDQYGDEVYKYIIAETVKEKIRVQIFPESMAKFEKWHKILYSNEKDAVRIVLNQRPRVSKATDNLPMSYCIGASGISIDSIIPYKKDNVVGFRKPVDNKTVTMGPTVVEETEEAKDFIGYLREKLTRDEFLKALASAGQCCINCGKVFAPEDHKEIEWLSKDTILCEECSKDPSVEELVRNVK